MRFKDGNDHFQVGARFFQVCQWFPVFLDRRNQIFDRQDVAVVVSDPEGGLARVPAVARVVVALTGSRGRPSRAAADEIATRLTNHSRIDRIVSIPDLADATPI